MRLSSFNLISGRKTRQAGPKPRTYVERRRHLFGERIVTYDLDSNEKRVTSRYFGITKSFDAERTAEKTKDRIVWKNTRVMTSCRTKAPRLRKRRLMRAWPSRKIVSANSTKRATGKEPTTISYPIGLPMPMTGPTQAETSTKTVNLTQIPVAKLVPNPGAQTAAKASGPTRDA